MQKTENYNLNKPEATDPLRVADFNENAEIIDGLLGNLNTAVGTKAEQSAVTALSTALAGRKRVATGSFIGNDKSEYTLALDFTPSFALIVSELSSKPYLNIATPGMGAYFDGSRFTVCSSRCVENGIYITGNASNSKEGNYYLAVE